MKVAVPDSVQQVVAQHFEPGTFRRGLDYARDGRVHLVRGQWPVVARVSGSAGYVVTVYYTAANRHMSGECSCPVAVDCKHAVAAALVALTATRDDAETWHAHARQEAVGEWLANLELRTEAEPDTGSRYGVTYVLARDLEGLTISVHRSALLRKGGFGKSAPLTALADPSRGAPSWIEVDDLRRIALLRAVTRAGAYETLLPVERIDAELWRDLAGSGRLFWDQVGTVPLRPGPPRRHSVRWQELADAPGEHQIGVDGDLVLVPSQVTHYFDPQTREIGPLELDLPASLVQELACAPPVPTAMLATVQRSVRALVGEGAAAALTPAAADGDHPPLRPHITVALDRSGSEPTVEVIAEAVYADDRFPLAEWDPRRPAARDLVAEGQRLRRLRELVDDFDFDGAGDAHELLAYARYLVHRVVPRLADAGWSHHVDDELPVEAAAVPEGWVERLSPRSDSHDFFSLELGVVIAGRTVSLLPILLDAIRSGELPLEPELRGTSELPGIELRLPGGELVYVTGERLRRWLRPLIELELRGLGDDDALVLPDYAAVALADDEPGRFGDGAELEAARQRVASLLSLAPRAEPPGFGTELRAYQRQGLAWLRFLHDAGYGGLLADDMGLGKTVQLLALLEGLRQGGELHAEAPALVVAPRSVVDHWRAEAERFAPELAPTVHLGPERARSASELHAPLLVTSYQTMLRDIELLGRRRFTTVIFDEAQALKNPRTRLRRAAASLEAHSRFCITGTPVENHLGELWSQMDLVMPGLLGRRSTFEVTFRRPIEKWGAEHSLEHLRQRIRPFLLRRSKSSVELDLPDKIEIVEPVELESDQRDLYESLRLSLDAKVRKALRDRGVNGSSLVVLEALLRLRQICCDPRLVDTPEARKVESSAKLERLMSILEELCDAGRAVLVFSQFTSMLRLIAAECRAAKLPYLELTGATRKREEVVRAFQDGAAPIFLISLKAGGTGLHLTRADTVIHYDPWWNPAVEDQASDRAHRIGQDKKVVIYKLVARGTLEERITALQREKRDLTTAALLRGGVTHLAPADLEALYRQIV